MQLLMINGKHITIINFICKVANKSKTIFECMQLFVLYLDDKHVGETEQI